MGFETKEDRAAREKAEAAFREANIKRYEEKMGVELPYSPVTVVERPIQPIEMPAGGDVVGLATTLPMESEKPRLRDRSAYMKDFRSRPVVCPNCGHKIERLARQKKAASSAPTSSE